MKPLATTPRQMRRSGIRMIMDLAWQVPDAIHLEVGQPDFDTPEHIIEAGCRAARSGFTKYTPNAGIPSLREAIVRKLKRRNGIEVTPDHVVATPGAVTAMATSLLTLTEAGEEVLIPDPGWPNYEMAARAIGAVPVRYPLDPNADFLPDFAALEGLVTERTKVLMTNTPSNPTGAVFPEAVVRRLVEFAGEYDLYLISDEVYEDIVFEGKHVSAAPFDRDGRVISVFGFSKSYAMTGWRLGYAVAPLPIAEVITKMQEPFVSCPVAISQKAAEAALEGPQDAVREMCAAYRRRRDAAVRILKEHDLFTYSPRGAFYLLMDISGCGKDSYTFAKDLLREKKVAVAPGGTFGEIGERYIRISLATAEEHVVEGLTRVCTYIKASEKHLPQRTQSAQSGKTPEVRSQKPDN